MLGAFGGDMPFAAADVEVELEATAPGSSDTVAMAMIEGILRARAALQSFPFACEIGDEAEDTAVAGGCASLTGGEKNEEVVTDELRGARDGAGRVDRRRLGGATNFDFAGEGSLG